MFCPGLYYIGQDGVGCSGERLYYNLSCVMVRSWATHSILYLKTKKDKNVFFFGFSILGLPPTVEWPLMHDFKFHILKSFFSTNYYQFLFFFSNAIKFFYLRKYIPFT